MDRYDYDLPPGRIAVRPPPRREDARLLVVRRDGLDDRGIAELPELLSPGDLLVVNDTRVMPARVRARRATGGAVEVLFLEPGDERGRARAMARPGRRLREGEALVLPDPSCSLVLERRHPDGSWTVRSDPPPPALMDRLGEVPLPPYLRRGEEPIDRERYQTVYARHPGAVAAPTAGLHLTEALLARVRGRGVEVASLTLHVGPGTFRSLRPEDLRTGELHPEDYEVPAETAEAVARARERGGRVVAVGTTTVRALESAAMGGGRVRPGRSRTTLFIREGHRFRVVDALLTNFHLPRSSLLVLVCAFGGRERVLGAYRHAVRAGYRFYSYGDAMFLSRREGR